MLSPEDQNSAQVLATMMSYFFELAATGAITSVTQTAHNTYAVTYTGTVPVFKDPKGEVIATTRQGNTFTVTDEASFSNVDKAEQDGTQFPITTWKKQHQATAACCRERVPGSLAADSDYQLYTPKMTLNNAGTRLTITATRTAPQMTFAMTGGLMLAVDTPGANPAAALSRTVTLPAGQDYRNGAGAWTATITACGLISDEKEACTSYPHAGPSPPSPPNPPPSPPFTPPSPPSPPGAGSPPGASDGPVSSLTERVRSLSTGAVIGIVVGVIVAVALIGALLWYKLLRKQPEQPLPPPQTPSIVQFQVHDPKDKV